MDESSIRKYAQIMKEEELTALEISDNGQTLRLERMPACAAPVAAIPAVSAPQTASAPEAPKAGGGSYVTSPMVGVVYIAPTENSDPYVKVGDRVKAGDTLCIVEAMKLMNEIPAEWDGVVTEICIQNEQVVDYGTKLFRIEK
ncbi:MAG: acetyl-CoA carboxylase biotin carboxyl carrier protein [Parasporobacterium sp.]|nr:acetyl-CoA carboxylase biotin carboxyl carrier protein [Parasporobacterium sp.]